jgi:hypothetical protein
LTTKNPPEWSHAALLLGEERRSLLLGWFENLD